MTDYIQTTIDEKIIYGFSVRTNNIKEQNIETRSIDKVWNKFYTSTLAQVKKPFTYGVYHSYASDYNDDFTVTVGYEGDEILENAVMIQAGKYFVFSKTGSMPDAVIACWQDVWHFFENNPTIKRAYKTDFEEYFSENEVRVYIGIQE